MANRCPIEAIVGKICQSEKGSFAVCYQRVQGEGYNYPLPLGESITFGLGNWSQQDCPPEPGQVVVLENVRKFERGWRAKLARPLVL